MSLRLYYDVVCPFAYLAFEQLPAIAAEAGVELELRPVLLGGILQAVGSPERPGDHMAAAKARLTTLDALRQAERAGVTLQWPPGHPFRTVDAMRMVLSAPEADRAAVSRALYRAYWEHGRDLSDLDVLAEVGAPFGLDPRAAKADPSVRQALFDATDEAVAAGAFGVPTVVVNGELRWGADRLPQVREALGLPRAPLGEGGGEGRTVTFFHDFSSPYSYLAARRIDEVASARGSTVEWVPFLLGALFKAIGTPVVPLHSFSETRQAWLRQDQRDLAAYHGLPFRFPSTFPLRTVTALRAAIVEPGVTRAVYDAAWVGDLDIGDADVLRGVIDDAGFDGAAVLARTQDPAVKDQLRRNTDRALAAGVCGAPSFQVDDLVFWGQDRLDMVSDALAGWRPRSG